MTTHTTGGAAVDAATIARRHGVSVRTVYRLAEAGMIPSYRVGRQLRFVAAAVDAALLGRAAR